MVFLESCLIGKHAISSLCLYYWLFSRKRHEESCIKKVNSRMWHWLNNIKYRLKSYSTKTPCNCCKSKVPILNSKTYYYLFSHIQDWVFVALKQYIGFWWNMFLYIKLEYVLSNQATYVSHNTQLYMKLFSSFYNKNESLVISRLLSI